MSGTFSSEAQSIADTSFYNINLVMHPIWENDKSGKWLYVEQAVAEYIDKPYRQRVYRLSPSTEGKIESRVYELPNPKKYIHAWDQPSLFEEINPDSLVIREGCSVYMKRINENCFEGSTLDDHCKSTLRGASYATSTVTICEGKVMSWDQGWNDTDEQVWGAVKEGYVFDRIK